tara:strand:- start:1385 stop:1837 length:453 start_codon:yes stop_codon:yes gene_type:complete
MKNIFDKTVTDKVIERINELNSNSEPKWGKMSVGQMLAHCCVTYEFIYDNKHPKPKGFKKWMLKTFVKKIVTNEKPYKRNGRTAPEFLITSEKEFNTEKDRLTSYILKTQELGTDYFHQKESHSFGKLNSNEWNNMFYKHLDHHLNQFGV